MTDKEWERFVAWWRGQWPASSPHRPSVEKYLEYRKKGE